MRTKKFAWIISLLSLMVLSTSAQEAVLTAPTSLAPGQDFQIQWRGPDRDNDFLVIVDYGDPEGTWGKYTYKYVRNTNPVTMTTPSQPGAYEVRYCSGPEMKTLGNLGISVGGVALPEQFKPAPALQNGGMVSTRANVSLSAPTSIDPNQDFFVNWTGPNNQGDFLVIVDYGDPDKTWGLYQYKYTSEDNPLKLTAPSKPGAYEVRYAAGGTNTTLGSIAISVGGVPIPAPIASKSQPQSSPRKLPERQPEPGFTPSPALNQDASTRKVTISGPGKVTSKNKFQVNWQGPNNPGDHIAVYDRFDRPLVSQSPELYRSSTKNSSPSTIQAPKSKGSYKLVYVAGDSGTILASQRIFVEEPEYDGNLYKESEIAIKLPGVDLSGGEFPCFTYKGLPLNWVDTSNIPLTSQKDNDGFWSFLPMIRAPKVRRFYSELSGTRMGGNKFRVTRSGADWFWDIDTASRTIGHYPESPFSTKFAGARVGWAGGSQSNPDAFLVDNLQFVEIVFHPRDPSKPVQIKRGNQIISERGWSVENPSKGIFHIRNSGWANFPGDPYLQFHRPSQTLSRRSSEGNVNWPVASVETRQPQRGDATSVAPEPGGAHNVVGYIEIPAKLLVDFKPSDADLPIYSDAWDTSSTLTTLDGTHLTTTNSWTVRQARNGDPKFTISRPSWGYSWKVDLNTSSVLRVQGDQMKPLPGANVKRVGRTRLQLDVPVRLEVKPFNPRWTSRLMTGSTDTIASGEWSANAQDGMVYLKCSSWSNKEWVLGTTERDREKVGVKTSSSTQIQQLPYSVRYP